MFTYQVVQIWQHFTVDWTHNQTKSHSFVSTFWLKDFILHIFICHLYYVYWTTYKIMMNFGALNWFDSLLKSWRKALDCINQYIYTPDNTPHATNTILIVSKQSALDGKSPTSCLSSVIAFTWCCLMHTTSMIRYPECNKLIPF